MVGATVVQDWHDAVLSWFRTQARPLAWRRTDDPYAVLVSEVMLQQTQAARVEPLFTAFCLAFPTPAALARAPLSDVLRAWRGLGYNRRAVALHRAARVIVDEHGGSVPRDYAALRALPGVGAYTARAVLAFAFGVDAAPVDTNVARVLARGVAGAPLRASAAQVLADDVLPRGRAAAWSGALMDLGAAHCTARTPGCGTCPVAALCAWQRTGGPDPAAPPRAGGAPQPFAGSNRFHRGRLVDALRSAPVSAAAVAVAAELDDPRRARTLADRLVADGLAEWDGATLRLPG